MTSFPKTGKVHPEFFKSLVFPFRGASRPEVSLGPQYGADVAIVRIGNGYEMALTSDPLSLIPTLGLQESAWLSVHLMANDMATTGYAPQYAQFVLNLPETLSSADFEEYWQYIHHYCDEIGTAITGGHTGKVVGQHSSVSGGGTMISIAPEGHLLSSNQAQSGDVLIVTKESAQVATSILALSFPKTVKNKCGQQTYQEACELFYQTSTLSAALIVAHKEKNWVNAMHDVTEGGILGAIQEMAVASDCGVLIKKEKLIIGSAQQKVCGLFKIDPLFSIGAGAMVIAAKKQYATKVIETLTAKNILATAVGEFRPQQDGINIFNEGEIYELEYSGTDPYWAAFHTALAQRLD